MVDIVYRNNDLLPLFGERKQLGGTAYEWRVATAANSSTEIFTEGSAQPTAVAQTYAMATLAWVYYRAMVRVTGHLKDAIRGMAVPDQFNVILQEYTLAAEDIRDLMNTTNMGTGNNGLQLAIDSAGTYAAINRSTTAAWGSFEDAQAVSHANLMTMRRTVRDAERGGKPDIFIVNPTEEQAIQNLVGAPNAQNTSVRYDTTASAGRLQLAPLVGGTRFGEIAVVGVPDFTADILLCFQRSDVTHVIHREMEERPDQSGDDDLVQISVASTLVHRNPRRAGKFTSF
ncbi:MAG: hypothetical protein V3W44_09530 [Dehalococcoidales bacterium]